MRRFLTDRSLRWQLLAMTAACVLVTSLVVFCVTGSSAISGALANPDGRLLHARVIAAALITSLIALLAMGILVNKLLQPLDVIRYGMKQVIAGRFDAEVVGEMPSRELSQLKETFDRMVAQLRDARRAGEESKQSLARQTDTVNRLLEFSQTIQGAGKADQVFTSLAHFLRIELNLSALAILAVDRDSVPATQLKAALPAEVVAADRLPDLDQCGCPCLRQNLPRHFANEHTPIRCGVDSIMQLPTSHPAYCIPFNIRQTQCMVHMLLPVGVEWTQDRRQLAQTYVNAAHSMLISLHLLAEAEKQSMTDVLTGLYNRRSMEMLMEREVALAERHHHPLSLVMIDMDEFKQINDGHGHAAGDHLLKAFADCVRITLRKTDLAFRYGGDEFVIALPQTPIAMAQQVVQKLRQAFSAVDFSSAIAHLDRQPTLSIGVAERSKTQGILTLPQLMTAADTALYEAKAANRNCIRIYTPPQAA